MALSDHGQYSGVVDIARNGIDEVLRLKKQVKDDGELIRQLVDALENSSDLVFKDTTKADARDLAITAGRARLEGKL